MDTLIPIVGIVLLLGIAVAVVASRYKIARTTEAIIVTGRAKADKSITTTDEGGTQQTTFSTDLSGQRVVIGGGIFILPFIQQAQKISLESQSIEVRILSVPSADGILLDVEGIAIIKVGGTQDAVRLAAQRFGGDLNEIKNQTVETMSGALRGIVGKMTVRNIIGDRETFAQEAVAIAQETLVNQGLALDTFQIRTIADHNNYLVNLGRPEAAEVDKLAEIAEQEALQESASKAISVKREIALAQRELELEVSRIKSETDKAEAHASAAKPLEVAHQQQIVLEETRKVEEQKALVEEKRLEATVKKKADADRYEVEQAAEGRKTSTKLAAEAEALAVIQRAEAKAKQDALTGQGNLALAEASAKSKEAEARGNLAVAIAEADATKAKGFAEADSIRAKGEAEADSMQKRADAFKEYGEAAILETVMKALPEIAQPFADAYKGIDNLTIIDNNGASKLGSAMMDNISQMKSIVKSTTSIDIDEWTKGLSAMAPSSKAPELPNVEEL